MCVDYSQAGSYIYAVYSPKIGAGATSLMSSAELPAALILSALILGEKLTVLQIVGFALVIFAVFIVFIFETKAK
jgi:drug/metabolite transporter (DMT)-like permease